MTWDPAAFRHSLQTVLDEYVDEQGARLAALGADAERLVAAARAAVTGGKRFRASFCYWGFRAHAEPTDEAALVKAAASLELLHASALVHDDLMDASDTRRGHPSTHKEFETIHRSHGWTGDPEQYGASAAVLLGDLLLSWADEALRTCGLGHEPVLDALGYFDTTRSEVIAGQFLDVSLQARGQADVEQAMRVLRYKSAKYSIERPLHVGAALAGAPAPLFQALSDFGLPLGEAFQLRDDLLGVYGDPEVTGKPAGDDLSEGKRTVLVALTLEAASPTDANALEEALGRSLDEAEVARLRLLIDRSGAHAEVERRIQALTAESMAALAAAPVTEAARGVLAGLARAATQRVV